MTFMHKLTVAIAIISATAFGAEAKGPTADDFAKIVKAAPDKAPAKPAKSRKRLKPWAPKPERSQPS